MASGAHSTRDIPELETEDETAVLETLPVLDRCTFFKASNAMTPKSEAMMGPVLTSVTSVSDLFECPNGHILCSSSKVRVEDQCPACRRELGGIRCLALEKVAEFLELPCRYQSEGCTMVFHGRKSESKSKNQNIYWYLTYPDSLSD